MALDGDIPVHTPRLLVRRVRADDLGDLLVVNGDDTTTRFLPYATWRSAADGQAWFDRMAALQAAGGTAQYVIEHLALQRVIGSCLLFELICQRLRGLPSTLGDGSAVLTGWLLALTLPPWAPWWVAVVGSGIAIVIGKAVFGGLGQNLFNPAMVARVALVARQRLPVRHRLHQCLLLQQVLDLVQVILHVLGVMVFAVLGHGRGPGIGAYCKEIGGAA